MASLMPFARSVQAQALGYNWIDRALAYVSPALALRRLRARVASDSLLRHYEGAATGRRTEGWHRSSGDANAAMRGALSVLRGHARDLVRNNGYAESALTTIQDHVVGWGITAKATPRNRRAAEAWASWSGTTACDAEGRNCLAGLQKLIMRTVVESGEVLVRRRVRRPEDGLPIPLQLQVLEPDYLDTSKTDVRLPNGGRIIYGIELDAIGRRAAYWLFPEHPGSTSFTSGASQRVSAEGVLHIYRHDRPGQIRGATWFAPILVPFKDFDDYADATLMKQRVAACLAAITTDPTGIGTPLGTVSGDEGEYDMLSPGLILNAPPGRDVTFAQPPSVRDYPDYTRTTLREIATGLGVSYEDLTGDYSLVNFSSARMSRLRHWARVEDWRWNMLIPLFCDPVWTWAMELAAVMGAIGGKIPTARWTAPPLPMIEPDKEGLAHQRNIRSGLTTLYEVLRERGYDPDELLAEYADVNKELDRLGIILDSDPRQTTQAGQPREAGADGAAPPAGGNAE